MKLFNCDDKIKSYRTPIFKMFFSAMIIALSLVGRMHFDIKNSFINIIVGMIGALLIVLSVACFNFAICDIILLSERRAKSRLNIESAMKNSKSYSVNSIISLLNENDIIEISIIYGGRIIHLGASSDNHSGSSKFFDKRYYFDGEEDVTPETLKKRLSEYSNDGKIDVALIDGVSAKC